MKNVLKNTKRGILTVALLATVTGFAKDSNDLIKRDAGNTSLVLEHVKVGNLLSIKDNYGIILYKEAIETNGLYKKGFDLTALPEGNYFFELEKDLEITTIPFTVDANKVNFNKKNKFTYFKPFIKQKGNLVYVTKLTPELNTTSIKVYSVNGSDAKLGYSEKFENVQVIEKVFKLEEGNYKIVINSNNKEYTKFINN